MPNHHSHRTYQYLFLIQSGYNNSKQISAILRTKRKNVTQALRTLKLLKYTAFDGLQSHCERTYELTQKGRSTLRDAPLKTKIKILALKTKIFINNTIILLPNEAA